MKQLFLILLALSACQLALAQLKADAGPDTVWCSPAFGTSGPWLGGTSPASGGTPPYSYVWRIVSTTGTGYSLLDTPTSSHPRLVAKSGSPNLDSALFQLRVTDSTGTVALDTVIVYISRPVCCMADYPVPKRAADTVRLTPASCCSSNFEPKTFLHWDTSIYLSDSTDPYSRCWCSINYFYYPATFIDRIGCPVPGGVVIYIQPNAVSGQTLQADGIDVVPNPVTSQSELRCDATWMRSVVIITTSDGSQAGRFTIRGNKTPLASLLPQTSGIYSYRIVSRSGKIFSGKLVK